MSGHAENADTIRTVECYADCVVLRHFLAGSAKTAASAASIPVLNAGDGPGQHPTQVEELSSCLTEALLPFTYWLEAFRTFDMPIWQQTRLDVLQLRLD